MTTASGAPGTAADGYRAGELVDGDVVERVAVAIADREAEIYGRSVTEWGQLPPRWHEHYRRLAAAAVAAMPASPAEEARRRVEVLIQHADDSSVRTVRSIRAALAPQDGEAGQ